MNTLALKARLTESGMTQRDVADKIGLSLSRFNAKLNNTDDAEFSLGEVRAMMGVLKISAEQAAAIFFA